MTEKDDFVISDTEESFHSRMLHSFLFNLLLIWKNLKSKKRSTVIIIIGLVFSMSILFTSSIWTNTSQKIIADDYIETLDYEMFISTFLTNAMDEVYEFVFYDPLVKQADWLFPTVALFNYEDKGQFYRWYPEENQENMTNPLSLSSAFVVSSRSIDRIKLNLEIEGNATLNSGEILVSYTQAKQLEQIYNETISPGYVLNVAITRKIPNTDQGEHTMQFYDIEETSFENYTISGIYNYVGYNSIIERLVGGGTEGAGGIILDSIIFPAEDLTGVDLFIMDSNGLLPRLLIKTNAQLLREGGITQMPDNLLALKERIEIRFFHSFCYVLSQKIQTMADEYRRSFSATSLFLPTIASAIFLTVLSTQITIKRRREEIAFLRSKGAASGQIIGLFFGEFVLISSVSLVLSIGCGILLAALIPSFGHNGFFSTTLFVRYFQYLEISPLEIEIFAVLVLGIYLGVTLINVISYVRKDIQESFLITRKGQQIVSLSMKLAAFALTIAGFIFLYIDYISLANQSYTFDFNLISASSKTLYVFIGVIFFGCYFASIGLNYLLKNIENVYKRIFKRKSFFIFRNIRRTRKSLTDLTFFLVLMVCLLSTFIMIRSTTINNAKLEDAYRKGADIRVHSILPVNLSQYEDAINNIPGVEKSLGFYSIIASIGYQNVEVFGVNATDYLSIGRWIDESFPEVNPKDALAYLGANDTGIILSEYIADRLGFSVGKTMFVTDFRGGPFYMRFNVSAIANSAPGLGVTHGYDPKMDRITTEWVLVNKVLLTNLGIENGTLFLADVKDDADIEEVAEQIRALNPLFRVNPEKINPDYIGYFITNYIPPVTVILLIGAIFIDIIAIIYVVISTEFTLEQRRREHAILMALGGKQSKIRKQLISEIASFIIVTIIVGIPLGILTTLIGISFLKPILMSHEIVIMTLHIDGVALMIMIVSFIIAAILGVIPPIRKQMKYEIVHELRAIV
ncbi:MAG: ABC transporter permease [Candidatus Heimdallarchaeota archaeon]|nr:ABC transporter permease [Candidatus Heimdallarchaeota archaeon]